MFCERWIQSGEIFEDVIFSDEAIVQLNRHSRISYHLKGETRQCKPKPKHPTKLYIWAGISMRGATACVLFDCTMDSELYTKILDTALIPFIRMHFPRHHRFQQDNDPKHTSKYTAKYFEEREINWWPTPPESPDLNPIERVWNQLKVHLSRRVKPTNKRELIQGIQEFWRTKMTRRMCCSYINHLQTVIPKVIASNGHATVDDVN